MKKYQQIILALVFGMFWTGSAQATSLDELYRDIVRSDNQGYLPMFVKNRSIPDILSEEEALLNTKEPANLEQKDNLPGPINLANSRRAKEAAEQAVLLRWQNALLAVEQNRVTPLELEEITSRANLNDPKAIEVLAWMNARGIGVTPNLLEAFRLYQKAAALQVPRAADNALLVYKSMNAVQREQLNHFKN